MYCVVVLADNCRESPRFRYTASLHLAQPACQRIMCAALNHVGELERQQPDRYNLGISLAELLNKALDVLLVVVGERHRVSAQ